MSQSLEQYMNYNYDDLKEKFIDKFNDKFFDFCQERYEDRQRDIIEPDDLNE